jgi:histidinol-phosphate/aromatic aminotransferase/cobyric acid decarboxylase-like protein
MTDHAKAVLTSLNEQLGAIKDAASAEAAAPKLEELKTKLDGIRAAWTKLPEASLAPVREAISTQMGPLKQKAQDTLALPGLSDRIKALINEIVQRLTELVSPPPATKP